MQVPAPFEYERAASVEEALELLTQLGPDARLLAGGHSLLPMMKLRLASPAYLIDIDALADELGYIIRARRRGEDRRDDARSRPLESQLLGEPAGHLTDAERVIADPVVRNRGTIGGALCQADPSEDLSAVCAAIGAKMVIRGTGGERVLTMQEFHRGPYQTAVGPAEMLVEIRVPLREASGSAYEKVDRRVGDWAVVATGTSLTISDGIIQGAGVALAAVGSEVTSREAEESLGPAAVGGFVQAGRRGRRRRVPSGQRSAGLGGIQAARRRRVDRAGADTGRKWALPGGAPVQKRTQEV